MREFKYGVGVVTPYNFIEFIVLLKSEKSVTRANFQIKHQKDISGYGTRHSISMHEASIITQFQDNSNEYQDWFYSEKN